MTSSQYAKSIELPTDEIFKNLKNAKRCAIDIGGSLAKLAYYSTVTRKKSTLIEPRKDRSNSIYELAEEDDYRDQLHFVKFETKYMETCLNFIQKNLIESSDDSGFMRGKVIKVTGGGAYKFKDLLESKLGVVIEKEDEMACMIRGCNFLLKHIPDEAFLYQRHGNPEYRFQRSEHDSLFPYLLVTIGSGVSMLKVEGDDKYERIGGTSLGGGTFWGLGSILTQAKGFDELLSLAERGDHRQCDMLVRDIYGGDYSLMALPAELIASSFGKAARSALDTNESAFRDEDIAKSLLIAVSNDIGQIACLHARLHGLTKIYFGGYFIRGHPMTMHTITYGVNYWSKGAIQAMFLRHEGYLGAVGAFVKGVEDEDVEWCRRDELTSWAENYAGSSSGMHSPAAADHFPARLRKGATFDMFELDHFSTRLVSCPLLLDAVGYLPDTEDLTHDEPARRYWLACFEDATEKFAQRAIASQPDSPDAAQRADKFKAKYIRRLHELQENPCAYGALTVRNLLDTREHCLGEFHFADPYSLQKQTENEQALRHLAGRLRELAVMDWGARHRSLAEGLLAGNVFDWGAKEVETLLESGDDFGFEQAVGKLQPRPWLVDDLDEWVARLRQGPHRAALVFVDNSGFDIVMGVFPFTIELLSQGTKVILCANSRPALNDVTYNELTLMVRQVALLSPTVQEALATERLMIMESGQGSPCLDLRYIDCGLTERIKAEGVDLVVLEGMGRAVHTNFAARFTCDSLKVAVLKNKWLANRFGGHMFSTVFKYEKSAVVNSN